MDSVDLVPPIKFGNNAIKACPLCDANKQAPVRVGDYITFSGTRARDAQGDFVPCILWWPMWASIPNPVDVPM